jgi:hypothetical protein
MIDSQQLTEQAARIRGSGILGRPGKLQRLFDYLIDCAIAGKTPKEIDIAIDGFGRGGSFDVTQDAEVRVYIHKLRRKLDEFYAGAGRGDLHRIVLPRGEYRIALERLTPGESVSPRSPKLRWLLIALAASLLVNVMLMSYGPLLHRFAADSVQQARANPVWSPLINDDFPILVVVGDYYIFGETDKSMDVKRMVREFDINSPLDLDRYVQSHPEVAERYLDLGLTYLPTAVAPALRDLLPILAAPQKRLRVVLVSELTPDMLTQSDIVYVGYLSGLGMLRDVVFAGSGFTVGETFDELIQRKSGQHYISQAGDPTRGDALYKDYGYFSTFAGTRGNRIIIIAGTRDAAVASTAEAVAHPEALRQLNKQTGAGRDYEVLYEVYGVDRTNLSSKILFTAPLNTSAIWGK